MMSGIWSMVSQCIWKRLACRNIGDAARIIASHAGHDAQLRIGDPAARQLDAQHEVAIFGALLI
jgi:hypothetical protein